MSRRGSGCAGSRAPTWGSRESACGCTAIPRLEEGDIPDSSITINPGSGGPTLDTISKDGEHREIIVLAPSEWTLVAEANNAAIVVTRPAEVGKRHYITGVTASFDSVPTVAKRLELKEGATVKVLFFFADNLPNFITAPLRIAENTDVSLTLAAGGVGATGAITLIGWTA